MSNLNNNTVQLEALLAKINALPEAGSGGSGTDTTDATATADEIFAGETAYTSEGKVTGIFTIDSELTQQNDLISQITTLVQQKANPPSEVITPTGDITITENGTHDVTQYANAIVNVAGSGSSGGSVESCAIELYVDMPMSDTVTIYYIDGNQTAQSADFPLALQSTMITVLKNSLVVVTTPGLMISGCGSRIGTVNGSALVQITNNGMLSLG